VKILALLLLALAAFPCAGELFGETDRDDFLTAEAALDRGEPQIFEELAQGLADYPLYPYLRYRQLSQSLASATPEDIEVFLTTYPDTWQAGRLRRSWLNRLSKQGQWNEYVRFYAPDDSIIRRCQYLRRLLLSDHRDEALHQAESLWLRGESLPNACDPLLEAWRQAGGLTTELVWRRIVLAMDAGEVRLANYLGKLLPPDERIWWDRWRAVHANPAQILDTHRFTDPHAQRTRILTYGIARLARKAPSRAADVWDTIAARYGFPADRAQEANAAVGFALAKDGDCRGLSYLDRIPAREDNFDLQERRLRSALKLGYWDGIADWIDDMPDGRRKSEHWLYWQGRAEEIRGNSEKAQTLFTTAAGERSLWGFLAAERVELPYKLGGAPTPADPQRVARIERSPAIARIGELTALGRELDVRREWHRLTRDMGSADLMAAAVFAQSRGWPDQAIFTLAKSGYWDDLPLRFPLLYRGIVHDQADATGLDEAWIYALLRQESAFNPTAVSHAGATGLMQLMPATARGVARVLDLPGPARNDLYDPQVNITLGSNYLSQMQRRYAGNPVLAAAAYNAGPGNVDSWLPEQPVNADVWIATIPFRETRGYVRRVLAYRLIYDHRIGNPIKPLHSLMQPIGGEGDRE
jgi:soluble lytic murein transglycosylase